ncbi:uncharacterized protein LOC126786310 [Argentina anserina]|uniref:uncharacterized protein LOC126786310 n=1 Tax=Argentina anserina TaxID=57926 RepID=UPI0021764B30|nr:uncharacterized protein LOC126786310 [Potentilla anserina]
MADGDGPDQMDQFHRNEAISAVADDGFLAEEDDDYEDLYNDVNVGEGFYQSMRKNEELGFKNEAAAEERKAETLPEAAAEQQHHGAPIPSSGGGDGRGSVFGNQNPGFRGNEIKGSGGLGGPSGGGGGMKIELGQSGGNAGLGAQGIGAQPQLQPMPQPPMQQLHGGGAVGNVGNEGFLRQPGGVGAGNVNGVGGNSGPGGGAGCATAYVGDLHWWTTDAELEAELCKYGAVKDLKFYDEKASGKSKGYCQVDFYDPAAAMACKEAMNGHLFNGRPCVVAVVSPYTVKRMGEAQVNRNHQVAQTAQAQPRRGPNDAVAGNKAGGNAITTGGNYQGGDNNNRGFGRANWGRGNSQGMGGRGPGGPMRNRGGMTGRGIMGNGGNGFGQGIGATPPLMHPQSMMGQGFDPAFGPPMGRMGGYGGFPGAPQPPFSGMMSSFPPVGGVGLPGVAPHVNPAFFGRGMPMSGMGMMPTSGVDGPNMGMWPDPSMGGGWPSEEHGGGRGGESSYGEEAGSDHQYGESSHDRAGWQNTMKEKERGSERDWTGSSDRRYREEREQGYDRDMPREKDVGHDHELSERRHRSDADVNRERDRGRERSRDRDRDRYRDDRERYADHHKYRDGRTVHHDENERGRSTRTHSKARLAEDDDHRSRSRDRRSKSRDVDYGKRRRLTSE